MKQILAILAVAAFIGIFGASGANAGPSLSITYDGGSTTQMVPGKTYLMKFNVKNYGTRKWENFQVKFTLPSGSYLSQPDSLEHLSAVPASAKMEDNLVWWDGVSLAPGKSFPVTLGVRVKAGTKIGTNLTLRAQAIPTDNDFVEKTFTVKAVRTVTAKTDIVAASEVPGLFNGVYGRMPTASEKAYWVGRLGDKNERQPFIGAMQYARNKGSTGVGTLSQ